MRSNSQSGFSLVEIAMVIMIIGLLIGGSLSMIKPYMNMASANLTKKKMENISLSLATFAQTYGRLPCPADPTIVTLNDPYGTPRNSVFGVASSNCGGGIANQIGIIPFKALGLEEAQVKDNYGNMITYAVNAAMTKYNSTLPNSGDAVHGMCRTQAWIDEATGKNKNIVKARVCCPDYDSNRIQLTNARTGGSSLYSGVHSSMGILVYNNPDVLVSAPPTPENKLIAFILISHGKNGDGAYIEHTTKTNPIIAPANSQESENHDNTDLRFVSAPTSITNDSHFFDDIIVWKTNDQLISAFGNDSCGRP